MDFSVDSDGEASLAKKKKKIHKRKKDTTLRVAACPCGQSTVPKFPPGLAVTGAGFPPRP